MATHIPIDVINDTEKRIANMRSNVRVLRQQERDKRIQAETIEIEASELEMMLDSWKKCFPGTLGTEG